MARDLDLGDQERHAEEDEQEPGPVDRQALKREEGQYQRDAPDDPRQDHARVRQLEEDPEHPDHHQDVGDVRVRDQGQELVAEPDLDDLDRRAFGPERVRTPLGLDDAAVDLVEKIRHALGHEVDDLELDRLALGDRYRRAHRLLRPFRVPPAFDRNRPGERGGVVLHLLDHGLVRLGPQRDGMRGADVGRRRHRGHVTRHSHEDPRGSGPRARRSDVDDHRDLGVEDGLDHGAHRAFEPAGRVEPDHERLRPVGLRAIDGCREEPHRDRRDGAVEVDHGDRLRRPRSARHGQQSQQSEEEQHQAPHRVRLRGAGQRAPRSALTASARRSISAAPL